VQCFVDINPIVQEEKMKIGKVFRQTDGHTDHGQREKKSLIYVQLK